MRVLITGGNGFLGSNLTEFFIKLNYKILVISRDHSNIENSLGNLNFIKHSSADYILYEKQILEFNPEVVLHLAWNGGNSYNDINDVDQIHKNISPSLSLLQILAKQNKKPKFVGFGSFLEYGKLSVKAVEDQKENPDNFYGLSKNIYKAISKMYCTQHNIDWVWVRPCYIYGKSDVPSRLIPSVINKKLLGESVVLDSCDKTIDYLHVEDFCLAIGSLVNADLVGTFNICSGMEYNLRDVLNFIDSKIKSASTITYEPKFDRPLAPKYVCGSNSKLKEETGWFPKISLEDGLSKTIDYYKSVLV